MGAEWVAACLTLLGFLGSLVSAFWARSERLAAAQAAADAHEVQESMAASQAAIAQSLVKPSVAFAIEPYGTKWMLKNVGRDVATSLSVEWPSFTQPQRVDDDRLAPGTGIAFGIKSRRVSAGRPQSMRIICDQHPDGMIIALPGVPPPTTTGWG